MGKYDDIIDIDWPIRASQGRMTMLDRAKIFLPFAALKGYEDAIAMRQHITVARHELSEDMKDELDFRINILEKAINDGNYPIITVIYFRKEISDDTDQGLYIKKTGVAVKLNFSQMYLQIVEDKIELKNIYSIEGELFGEYAI